jgi:hypothetical protein
MLFLTRGFGQSALSVVSLAIMGRSVGRRSGPGVGVYSCVTALGFMAAFGAVKHVLEVQHVGWRTLWNGVGVSVACFGVLAALLVGPGDRKHASGQASSAKDGLTLSQSLRTGAFWTFAGATSFYGLIAAGLSLFNQAILAERGFDRGVFLTITMVSPMVGLAANLATGWLATRVGQGRILASAMALLAIALLCFPLVRTLAQVYVYAVVLGIAGGMVTVVFFGVWGEGFGTAHIGKIQGAAQLLTVLASAAGPLAIAAGQRHFTSYTPVFRYAAIVGVALAALSWIAHAPLAERARGSAS